MTSDKGPHSMDGAPVQDPGGGQRGAAGDTRENAGVWSADPADGNGHGGPSRDRGGGAADGAWRGSAGWESPDGDRRKRRFRPSDILLVIAGADREVLARWDTDRTYYVGMGVALLFAATISTCALAEATSIAFHVKITSPGVIAASAVYFLLLYGLDRWLVSDQTAGFAPQERGPAGAAWTAHFITEFFKIAPRIAIALLSSWLFATFVMLAIFNPEIQKQLRAMDQQDAARYALAIDAQAQDIINQAKQVIGERQQLQRTLATYQQDYKTTEIQEQSLVSAAHKQGQRCHRNPVIGSNGLVIGYRTHCPRQINTIYATYGKQLRTYQGQIRSTQDKIRKLPVTAAEHSIANAHAAAVRQLAPYAPKKVDGLLARMKALGLLTTKPSGTCPVKASLAQRANDAACVSQYSPDAGNLHLILQFWLMGFEILPVVIKFVHSVLPRRGYASIMAAREEGAKATADVMRGAALMWRSTELARISRSEHVRLEEEGALLEYQLRELARQERRIGLSRVRRVFTPLRGANAAHQAADANGQVLEGTVIPPSQHLHADNPRVDPGNRIIDSEDFL